MRGAKPEWRWLLSGRLALGRWESHSFVKLGERQFDPNGRQANDGFQAGKAVESPAFQGTVFQNDLGSILLDPHVSLQARKLKIS